MARTYSHPRSYNAEEKARLTRLYTGASQEELLAAFPGRSLSSIRCQAGHMKLHKLLTVPTVWTEAMDAILRQYYPSEGPTKVAQRLKLTDIRVVKRRAWRLQVHCAGWRIASPAAVATPAIAAPATSPAKPAAQMVAEPPAKRSAGTPILDARMDAHRRAARAREEKPKPYVTAAEIKALGANHPARWAWTRAAHAGPAAATEAFHAAMQLYKQAA